MTDILEAEECIESKFTHLEGEYQPAQQKTYIFSTLSDLTAFVTAFRIENGQFTKGVLRDTGKTVFQLTYLNEDL